MHSADYDKMFVHLSVCHTPVFCLKGYTYPQSLLAIGSPTILVFPHQMWCQYSDGDPLTGASNARGYEKITIFDEYLALFRKMMQDDAMITMEGE